MGLVGPPFGLKGFVKVKPFSGETGHFFRLNEATLSKGGKEETKGLAEIITQGDTLLIRFAGTENPEAAALLKGAEIIVGRELAAPLKEGEYYIEDLRGLEVVNREGEPLGQINDVVEGGGGFLAEVRLVSGDAKLVPFRKEFIGEVDIGLGKIELLEPWILE